MTTRVYGKPNIENIRIVAMQILRELQEVQNEKRIVS